jgi:DNA polymerase
VSDATVVARLEILAQEAAACTACRLSETRTQAVFADGSADAELMFIGEAPGFHEDEQGLPFVGAAGKLLDQLLGEIGLRRSDTYIANVLKCRPPKNRDPRPDEVAACKGYLAKQVELVDPVVVITLGNFATKLLLKREVGITRLRGQVYPWWGRVVIPTFHPAAALRGGERVLEAMRTDLGLARTQLAEHEVPPEQLGLFS